MKFRRSISKTILFGLLSATLLTTCRSHAAGELSIDEYSVYMAVIRSRPPRPIVINTTIDTFGEVSSGALPELFPGIRPDTIDDWVSRNKESLGPPANLRYEEGYEVMVHSEIPEHESHYCFTRVGFSRDGEQAFVRFVFVCDPLCSEGAFYLLENKQGVWEIVFKSESWKT